MRGAVTQVKSDHVTLFGILVFALWFWFVVAELYGSRQFSLHLQALVFWDYRASFLLLSSERALLRSTSFLAVSSRLLHHRFDRRELKGMRNHGPGRNPCFEKKSGGLLTK